MGLFDLFKMGKVIAGTMKAVRSQRNLGKELAALPMDSFVPTCRTHLNESADNWQERAREPIDSAEAIARTKQLPDELVEFYRICDGFEGVHSDFPALIHPLQQLQIGAAHTSPLSALLADSGTHLPRGTVIEVEGGSATRYQGFKAWLATRASLFASIAIQGSQDAVPGR